MQGKKGGGGEYSREWTALGWKAVITVYGGGPVSVSKQLYSPQRWMDSRGRAERSVSLANPIKIETLGRVKVRIPPSVIA